MKEQKYLFIFLYTKQWMWVHHTIPTDSVPTDAIPTVHAQSGRRGLTAVE